MSNLIPFLSLFAAVLVASFFRLNRPMSAALLIAAAVAGYFAGQALSLPAHWAINASVWGLLGLVLVTINVPALRKALITAPFLRFYERIAPALSETEQVALAAGTVGFEGELFSGKPDWSKLLSQPVPKLSAEEQAFVDGPVEEVCKMTNDWEVTHERADLTPEVWDYLKCHKFFGMIIPKSYGGLGFSAYAHSAVLQKLNSLSAVLGTTVAVPNSLGPAELLLHYGTEEQKNHYLPRLADGREIPCFGLTNPYAGSDATSIPDFGIVCKGQFEGKEVLGIRLTFDKRYITLAPVATVIGIAFRMYDPDQLVGTKADIGITLVLVPRDTAALEVGRRHFPLNVPFQNGPVRGKDVFLPLSYLIGGQKYAGQGWRMLVECLSVGRAISLPSGTAGGARTGALATGAYARIRKQFGLSIGRFEGVEEALARIGGHTYQITALSRLTAAAVDLGEKPSVPSAIAKYHATELGRQIVLDAMDIHAGKGVILGPKNWIGRFWQGSPIAITVEGANILTRSMIIFGQGATRCHPYVLKEMQAAAMTDPKAKLDAFDAAVFGHMGFTLSNAVRSLFFGLTGSYIGRAPGDAYTRRYYRKLVRYSAALALLADMAMLMLGGKLKFKERLSARLGDVLSQLYIASAVLKRYEDNQRPEMEQPMLAWAIYDCVFKMQNALVGALRNFPFRPAAWVLGWIVFPLGQRERAPGDRTGHRVAQLLMSPNAARDRLAEFCFTTACPNNPFGQMLAALPEVIDAEPIERRLQKAAKSGVLQAPEGSAAQLDQALQHSVITASEHALMLRVRKAVFEIISTDDFDSADLAAMPGRTANVVPERAVANNVPIDSLAAANNSELRVA
jgi:acyl-CoA dehydrogenase